MVLVFDSDNVAIGGFCFRTLYAPIKRYAFHAVGGVSTDTAHLVIDESYPLYQLAIDVF